MSHFGGLRTRTTAEDLETAARIQNQLSAQGEFEQLASFNAQLAGISAEEVAALPVGPQLNVPGLAVVAGVGLVIFLLLV